MKKLICAITLALAGCGAVQQQQAPAPVAGQALAPAPMTGMDLLRSRCAEYPDTLILSISEQISIEKAEGYLFSEVLTMNRGQCDALEYPLVCQTCLDGIAQFIYFSQ